MNTTPSNKGSVAKIVTARGQAMFEIDGKVYPPEFISPIQYEHDHIRTLGEAGFKVFFVECNVRSREKEETRMSRPYGIEETKARLAELFMLVPDAYVFLRINLSPSREWVNSHPEECVLYSDGSRGPVMNSLVGPGEMDGMYSLCSQAWMRDEKVLLDAFFDGLEQSPHFGRIVGTFLCGGGTWEWYYLSPMVKEGGVYSDLSEPFRSYYSSWLRRKYGTEEKLKAAWRREDASFDQPIIPNMREREVTDAIYWKILHGLRNWNLQGKIRIDIDMNGKGETTEGFFLNVEDYAYVADYYRALHDGTANTINFFSRAVKERYPHYLNGAFYGNLACTSYFEASHSAGVFELFEHQLIDFLSAPGTYNNREPGGSVTNRCIHDSMTLRNIAYVHENDSRTHRAEPAFKHCMMGLYEVRDSIETLKRDFARDLGDGVNGYWYDLSVMALWFDDDEIEALFRRQQRIAQASYAVGAGKHHDVAVIFDIESTQHVNRLVSTNVLDYYQTTDLVRSGVPYDRYYHDDMKLENMPDYKLYIMLNTYCLTDAERDVIIRKARKNNAVVLWLYAPGYINYDHEKRASVEHISRTVGMQVSQSTDTLIPHIRVNNQHPMFRHASARKQYGIPVTDVHSNISWYSDPGMVTFLNPVFSIEEAPDVEVLARYCETGKAAIALTEQDGYRSVYCTNLILDGALLTDLAEWAGCHVFSRDGDVLYANDHFVAVHAKDDGKRTLHFPKPCSPFEVYEQKYYGHDVTEITVDMACGDTRMWSVNDDVSEKLK